MARIALIISGVVVIAILLVSFFAGVFDTVKFSTETAGPYNLIYREFSRGLFPESGLHSMMFSSMSGIKRKSRPAEVLGSSMMIRAKLLRTVSEASQG